MRNQKIVIISTIILAIASVTSYKFFSNNVSEEVIQISNRNDPNWIPDNTIINPFIP